MLGREAARAFSAAGLEWIGSGRETSILEPPTLARFAEGKAVDWIVNCAGYTAVDRAEDEPGQCERLNAEGPGNLARLAAGSGAKILHLSSDYVFDGLASRPYREEDPVSPLGVYGRSKAAGEEAVRALCPEHVILRTAWLYGRDGDNFVSTMLRLMRERERIGVVRDQAGTPTWAADAARAMVAIVGGTDPIFGTYHYSDLGEATWFEFALEIQRGALALGLLDRACEILPMGSVDYPAKARRPAYSVLAKDKIMRDYRLVIPEWRESLGRFLGEASRHA